MDCKCILNEFYQRFRIAGLNYEFEETENAGFTCILALPAVPSGGNSSSQDQKGLQTPLSFHGTGSSKKKAAHAAAEAAVAHLQQQGLLAPPPGPSSSPAVGSKRSKANEEEETEPLQQRVLEALLACHPATLTAAALTKRCGDWMRKPKVNHLLYNPLSDAGLVEMVDDKQTPAWRATAAAVEAVRAAAVAAGALPCAEGPPTTAAAAPAPAPAGEEAAGGGTGGALVPGPGEGTAQEGAVPAAAAAAAAGGAAGVDPQHLIEGPLAAACTGNPTACTTMAPGAVDEAGPSTWVAALTEGQLAAAVAQVLARMMAEGVLTMHAAASGAASPVSSGKRTRSGAAAASGGLGGATSSASRPSSAHLREQQQRLGLLAALNQTATSRPTPAGDGRYTAGRASGGGAAAAAVAGGSMRPGWKRATSESAGLSWTSAHTTSGNTAAASHGCPPSPAAADAQDTATSSSSRRLPPVAGHRASPQAYSTRGSAPPVPAGGGVGSGSTGVFSPWQQARSSVGHPASKVPRTAADAMGGVHGLYPWGSSHLQQQAALGFVSSRGGQHLSGASLLGHQQQQGRVEMTAESLQGVLGGSLHLGSPAATTRAPDTAAAAGSTGCAANWGQPEQLQHQHQLREQVLRQTPNRAAAGLGASAGALHAAAMGAGLTSADDLEVLLSGLNHISSLPGAAAAADIVQRLGSGQLAPAAGPAPAAAVAAQVQLPGASIWTPSGCMLAPSTSAGGARGSSQGGAHSSRGLGPTAGGEQEGCSDDEVSPAVLAAAVEAACLEPAPLAADVAHTTGVYNAGPSAAAEAAAAAAGPTRNRSSSQGLQDPQLLLQGPRQQPVGPTSVRPAASSSSQQASGAHGPPPHPAAAAAAAAAAEAPGMVAAAAVRHGRSGDGQVGSPRSRWSPLTAFDHLTSATLAPIPPAPAAAVAVAAGVDMPHTFAAFGHNAASSSHHLAGGSLHPMALDLPAVPPAAAAAGAVGGGPAEGVGLKRKLPSTDSTEERAWCSPRTHHHHHQHQQQQQQQWQQHQQVMQSQQQAQGGDGGDAMCDEAPAGFQPYHHRQQHLQGIGPSLGAGMAGEGGSTPAAPRRRSQGDSLASGASPPEQQQQQPQQQQEAEVACRRRLKRQARQLDQASASSGADDEQQVAADAVTATAQGQGDPLVAVRHPNETLSVSGDAAVTDPTDMDSCAVSMTLGPDPAATAMAAAAAAGGLDGHHRSITPAAAAGGVGEEVEGVYEGTSSSLRTAAAAAEVGGMAAGGVSEDQALELLSRLTLPELPGGAVSGAARHHSHTTPGVAGAPAGDATPQDHLWQLTAGLGGLGLMQPGSDAHPAVDLAAEAATGRGGQGAADMQGRTQNANKRLKPLPPQLQEEYDRRVQNVRHLVLQLNEALQGLRSIQDQAGTSPGTGGSS